MTREYVEMAIKKGIPFEINMADGKSYRVEDEFSIALIGETALIVVENMLPHILPLLTVTGISYLSHPIHTGSNLFRVSWRRLGKVVAGALNPAA